MLNRYLLWSPFTHFLLFPAQFHHRSLSALHLYIIKCWLRNLCTVFYNKQIYVQHARVITFDKEPKLQIEWNKKNEAVGLLSAQSLQMLRPWSLQDTLHHRSNHITLQSGKERHVTDWPLRWGRIQASTQRCTSLSFGSTQMLQRLGRSSGPAGNKLFTHSRLVWATGGFCSYSTVSSEGFSCSFQLYLFIYISYVSCKKLKHHNLPKYQVYLRFVRMHKFNGLVWGFQQIW